MGAASASTDPACQGKVGGRRVVGQEPGDAHLGAEPLPGQPQLTLRGGADGGGPHPVEHDGGVAPGHGRPQFLDTLDQPRDPDAVGGTDRKHLVGGLQHGQGGAVALRRGRVEGQVLVGLEAEGDVDDHTSACRRRNSRTRDSAAGRTSGQRAGREIPVATRSRVPATATTEQARSNPAPSRTNWSASRHRWAKPADSSSRPRCAATEAP